jgi:hypothetical protein
MFGSARIFMVFHVPTGRFPVAYKSGRGPYGFRTGELEQAIVMSLLENSPMK